MKMRQFMKSLVYGSEKAACIARACRKENDLFQLLVEVSDYFGVLLKDVSKNVNFVVASGKDW